MAIISIKKMKINSDFDVFSNSELFNRYIFNKDHFFGNRKCNLMQSISIDEYSIEILIDFLSKVPLSCDMELIDLVAKAGMVYKMSNVSRFNINGRIIYIKSWWLYRSNSATISLLNLTIN